MPSSSSPDPDWYDLVVTLGDPEGGMHLVRPPRRARVRTRIYPGEAVTLELDVVARAPGRVLVEQPREGRDPWNAWISAREAVPLDS